MRKQVLTIASIVVICLITFGLIYAAMSIFVGRQFTKLEDQSVQQNAARAVDLLEAQVDMLGVQSSDWAFWDDTYDFMANRNKAYIASNMANESIKELGLTYMLFYDTNGALVYRKSTTAASESVVMIQKLSELFSPSAGLLVRSDNDVRKGVVAMNDQALLFYSRPILTSDKTGPFRGTIVFAHILDQQDAAQISELNRLTIRYYPIANGLPKAVTQHTSSVSSDAATISRVNASTIKGFQAINDPYGKPVLLAEVQEGRASYLSAQHALRYFVVIMAALIFFGAITVVFVVRKLAAKDEVIRLKDDFFSIASHEIRTPLAAIRGNAQLLNQIYGEKDGQGFIEITDDIKTSSERLIRLVTNFLDAARLEQGKMTVEPEVFALKLVVGQVVDELQGYATEKGIAVRNGITTERLRVYADKDHVKQVLYNLMGNALKFTDKGSVTVNAKHVDDMIRIYITDTGRGVPESGKAAMFEKFKQTTKGDAAVGTGLGLYISKILVQKMGGEIRLESTEEGKGTTISFSVPPSHLHRNERSKK